MKEEVTASYGRVSVSRFGEMLEILVLYVGLAMFGGLVYLLNNSPGPFSFSALFKRTLTSAFVGLIAALVMESMGLSMSMRGAISGACGYAGTDLLELLAPLLEKVIKKRLGIVEHEKHDEG